VVACLVALLLTSHFSGWVALFAAPSAQESPEPDQPQLTSAAPDLVITSITLTPPNPEANAGFNLYLYVDPVDEPPTQSTPYVTFAGYALPLPAGGSFKYIREGQTFTMSPPKVYAWVDPPWENKVAESNEDNNLFPSVATGGDAFEDDDTCADAKEIAPDGTIQDRDLFRKGDNPDVDWIKFNSVGGVTYLAEAIAVGADASLAVELHATCGGPPSFGNGAKMEFTAPANGTYYVKISHTLANYGAETDDQFKVTSDSGCTNYFEPNNACTLAVDLALATTQTHTFCKAGDADWLRFPVTAGAEYKITSANVGQKADVRLNLYMSCADVNNTASGQTLQFTAPEAGHIYIKAEERLHRGQL
jgi:hypothetical protein